MHLLTCCLVLWLSATVAHATTVQARLIRAANAPAAGDAAAKDLAGKLKKVFGYEAYRQLGQDSKPIAATGLTRLDIGEGFTLFCAPKPARGNAPVLDVELYSGRTLLVKQERLVLHPGKHVFIRGPEVGSTLLIVALTAGD